MGAMNVVMTVISLFLVEIAGRKTLLLAGFSGMFACTVSLCIALNYVSEGFIDSYHFSGNRLPCERSDQESTAAISNVYARNLYAVAEY